MAAITLEQLKEVVVHLSDKEFEELVEAREQAWDRQIEADPAGNWINWRKKRCAIIAKGSASGSRETRFDLSPNFSTRIDICRRAKARESYRLFVADPASVKFKAIKRRADGNQLCSARVTRDYRVLGVLANDIVIWFWIGQHDNYERLIRELR